MEDRDLSLQRRQYLSLIGMVGIATIAGCNNFGSDSSPSTNTEFLPDSDSPLSVHEAVTVNQYVREGQPGAMSSYLGLEGAYESTPSHVGSREMGTTERLVGHTNVSVTEPSFEPIAAPFTYGYLESAPNRIPVLKVICVLRTAMTGATLDVRVGTEALGVDNPLLQFGTETTERQWQYDEVYLNEVGEGTAARKPTTLSEGAYRVWARVSGGVGVVHAASSLILDWEVV